MFGSTLVSRRIAKTALALLAAAPITPLVGFGIWLKGRDAQPEAAAPQHQTQTHTTGAAAPGRTPPPGRDVLRGEHSGVIVTPGGWRALDFDPATIGPGFFTPYGGAGGRSFYLPWGAWSGAGAVSDVVILGASYEIIEVPIGEPPLARAGRGHWEMRAVEEPVPGEFVQVHHPAVYEEYENGERRLIEPEATSRVEKTRIITRRVWIAGPPPVTPTPAPTPPPLPSDQSR